MTHALVTAFEPYEEWSENASWLTLVELTKELPDNPKVTTRRYPVDFEVIQEKLTADLVEHDYDYAIHLGQAPGTACVRLEAIAVNVGCRPGGAASESRPLVLDGPVAYQSTLPLERWAAKLRENQIPAQVSFHAGTYLCNAALYHSLREIEKRGLRTQATFVHLPLEISQACAATGDVPSMPATTASQALRMILSEMD